MEIIASREGYNGEFIQIKDIEENMVYVEYVKDGVTHTGWYEVQYKIVDDGVYNQSVRNIDLPYIVIENDAYSIESFITRLED